MSEKPNIGMAVPFFMVSDMEVSLDFYLNKLSFQITKQWTPRGKIEWCWLERDSVAIMLQGPRKKKEPETMVGDGISICFQCEDALALYHEFTAKGVEIKEPFVGNGLWVVAFNDPDGFRLDFESPTDVEEETMYSDWVK
jgi:lactoylglutathione lyase